MYAKLENFTAYASPPAIIYRRAASADTMMSAQGSKTNMHTYLHTYIHAYMHV